MHKLKCPALTRMMLMSTHMFYTHGFISLHISTAMQITSAYFHGNANILEASGHMHPPHSYSILQTFGGLHYFNVPTIRISCTHVHHLQRFYDVFTHHASLHLQIFGTSYPHATTHPKNVCRHAYTYPIASLKH